MGFRRTSQRPVSRQLDPFVDTYGGYLAGMEAPVNSAAKSAILAAWYSIDYLLGTGLVRRARKSGDVIVFTRYYYDYYYQRVHLNAPIWVIRSLEVLVPKPDCILFLNRPARKVFDEKPELSVSEIERQVSVIRQRLSGKRSFYEIDCDQPLSEVCKDIENIISGA